MAQELDFDLPLSRYLKASVAAELQAKDVETLSDLIDMIYNNPKGWSEVIGMKSDRAMGIIVWLYKKSDSGIELPEFLLRKAQDSVKTYYGTKIEDVGVASWHEVVNQKTSPVKRRAGAVKTNKNLGPLETLTIPKNLDGSNGKNRGDPAHNALAVDTDVEAIKLWLRAKATNANTQEAYKKEAQRFLLWCLIEKRIELSSVGLEECSQYLRWLEMLGRTDPKIWAKQWIEPQETWIGPKNVSRESEQWKPFNKALGFTSRKSANTIVRQLFSFLQKTGYLKFNPFDQISSKVPLLPGEGKPKEFADRSLSKDQWMEIMSYLEKMPEDIVKARLKVILLLGKGLGMRASEMLNARCSWIERARFGSEETTVINIVGKGDKQRRLPLSDEDCDIINEYLILRGRPDYRTNEAASVPIIAKLRPGDSSPESEGLSRSGLWLILHDFLENVAVEIQRENPSDASKLRASSLHWLRHTFAVSSLEVMPVNIVQTALGHASVNTTTRYISPDDQAILEAMKLKNQSDGY